MFIDVEPEDKNERQKTKRKRENWSEVQKIEKLNNFLINFGREQAPFSKFSGLLIFPVFPKNCRNK